ncbi:hypothetical protein WH47_09775 [Habropoda laboriosa]|uniref:Uncharacterized protein n=1 Tax=Habropoda laboriosa TaxID=597456 RepID=A0A0L7QML0_9HYME|nr:hypothetical protein WH47_09775 [Habropoda laboriosa]
MEQCRGGCSHEMVNSPATAATMAYPTLEEERRSSGNVCYDHDQRRRRHHDDHDDDDYTSINVDHQSRRNVVDDDVHIEPCSGCSTSDSTATVLNRDFAHSYRAVPEASEGQSAREPSEWRWPIDSQRKPNERRSRKQSQPRKVTWNQEFEDDDLVNNSDLNKLEKRQEESCHRPRYQQQTHRLNELKKRCRRRQLERRRSFKCRLCPDDSPARGSVCRPYHTKASLALHKLWRHGSRCKRTPTKKDRPVSQVSSITLKATVFTSPGYGYHR